MRLIHTSDWQIGKTFAFAEDAANSLRDERLDAITRLGELAMRENATHTLVAGDIYDVEVPAERTLRQPIERMRAFPALHWHLIPGNHDAHTPSGPWERLRRLGDLPENVHLHLAPLPADIGGAWLLPAVLTRRHAGSDTTAWMDDAPTPSGAIRLGLAHGSIASFGTNPDATHNRIAPDRARLAGLDYLALGDWHRQNIIGERTAYSGTPETDDFNTADTGTALLVQIEAPGAPPQIVPHRTGRFTWLRDQAALHEENDINVLETRLRSLAPDLGTVLLWLTVSGALSLRHRAVFERRIAAGLGSALRVLRLDVDSLLPQPAPEDLAAIDHAGFVRNAADTLAALAADPANPRREIAAAALQRLYLISVQAAS